MDVARLRIGNRRKKVLRTSTWTALIIKNMMVPQKWERIRRCYKISCERLHDAFTSCFEASRWPTLILCLLLNIHCWPSYSHQIFHVYHTNSINSLIHKVHSMLNPVWNIVYRQFEDERKPNLIKKCCTISSQAQEVHHWLIKRNIEKARHFFLDEHVSSSDRRSSQKD